MNTILDKALYWLAASMATFGYMTWQNFMAFAGLVVAAGTFSVNWYYKARADKREQEKHKLEIENLKAKE